MANKIVIAYLMCLVLGEISYIQARIAPKKSVHVQRGRFLCEAAPKAYHHNPITEVYKSCFHNCVKPCPRDDEQKFFECELRCDTSCSFKAHQRRAKDGKGKQKEEKEEKVDIPKTGLVTKVHTVCYDECSSECANDDVKCLKKCDKICTKVSEQEISK